MNEFSSNSISLFTHPAAPYKVIVFANKTRFREDILSNRIEEIVRESFQRQLGKSVGANELASWKHSLRQIDSVLGDDGIPNDCARHRRFIF